MVQYIALDHTYPAILVWHATTSV